MTKLRIDLETYSSEDLKRCGVHRYAESDDFEVLLFAYAFNDDPVQVVDLARGEPLPARVLEALFDPAVVKTAWNAAFETVCLAKHFGRPMPIEQWRCSMVHALYLGLPGGLGDAGRVVGLDQDKQKMSIGWSLIRYFCIPCKPTKSNGGRSRNLPKHDPDKWSAFVEYCRRDVEAEREIETRLAKFQVPDIEWKLWHLDQRMMARGVMVDRELMEAAIECDAQATQRLLDEAMRLTGLENPNSRSQLLAWLQEAVGENVTDLTKKTVPKVLQATDNATVKRVLRLRQELAKTSVSKYHAMARGVCKDDCVRGLTQFYGANRTGRWAGRLVQVQNLASNKLRDLDLARQLVKERDFDCLQLLFGLVPDTLSQLIRTTFIARPGHHLVPIDFSAIEARVIAWLSWCEWRLEVFRTHGKIYEASAEQMFKLPAGSVTKKSPYRQRGKVAELALGYQGGANALKTMGALEMGVPEDELEGIKHAWRKANPQVVRFWFDVERCALEAVAKKTNVSLAVACGRAQLGFSYESGFLFITLPSGRRLAYVKPRIEGEDLYRDSGETGRYLVAREGSLTYEGTDQKTKQWTRLSTYGGKLVENITQAVARDCLREAMLALDEEGITQLFTVHDEIVLEASEPVLHRAEEVMRRPIPWAPDLPLRGDGFETPYYMKEID